MAKAPAVEHDGLYSFYNIYTSKGFKKTKKSVSGNEFVNPTNRQSLYVWPTKTCSN